MTITAKALPRVFSYNGAELADPSPELSPEDVKSIYAANFPELVNASIEDPVVKEDRIVISFTRTAGAKGYGRA